MLDSRQHQWTGEDRRQKAIPVLTDRRGGAIRKDSMVSRQTEMLGTAMQRLTPFLYDERVTDINLNPDGRVWVDQGKGSEFSGVVIPAHEAETIVRVIATATGQECTAEEPIISAEIPTLGYRFEGNIPPVAEQPVFSIRKPAVIVFRLSHYERTGIMSAEQSQIIRKAVSDRQNILVVGGTGSGKTTLTNAILCEIPEQNRVILIEDTRELQCSCPNTVSFRTSNHPTHPVSMGKLVRSCMRHKPDRIVIGEVRGGEALDLLKAWNTGHPGGVATIHANSAAEGLDRVEQCVMEVAVSPPQKLIGAAVNLVIFIENRCGKRQVSEILRCRGFNNHNHQYILEEAS